MQGSISTIILLENQQCLNFDCSYILAVCICICGCILFCEHERIFTRWLTSITLERARYPSPPKKRVFFSGIHVEIASLNSPSHMKLYVLMRHACVKIHMKVGPTDFTRPGSSLTLLSASMALPDVGQRGSPV